MTAEFKMNELKIGVLSDLHCHHSSQGPAESILLTDADRNPWSQHPVESLLALIGKEQIQADLLLMPGDITNKIDRQGMISGWGFINEIAAALQVEAITPTLGNHDVNSRKPEEDPFKLARGLSPKFPNSIVNLSDQFWSKGFYVLDGTDYRVLIINSVKSHLNEETAKQGFISDIQLDEIRTALTSAPDKIFRIAVCHHHPILHEDIGLGSSDVMKNGSLLVQLLSDCNFNLIVHGHKHHPKLSFASGNESLPIFAAGSFSAGMKNGLASRTRNVFHHITIEYLDDQRRMRGRILTWQFRQAIGWTPASWDAVDFPHKTGFGAVNSPAQVALQIHSAFSALGSESSPWNAISRSIPDLQFLSPAIFQKVGFELKVLGLDLCPIPPNEPQYIGKIS